MNKNDRISAPISEEEYELINKFKELLKSKQVEIDYDYFDNYFFLKFLRARKLNLDKAFLMICDYLKWFYEHDGYNSQSFKFEEIDQLKKYYPHAYHKTDKTGRPVYIELYGHINPDGVYQTTTEDRLERYVLRECEHMIKVKMPKCSEKAGKFISQAFVIIDLNKMSFGFMQKKHNVNISQNYYPELLGQCVVINLAFILKAGWAIVKAFLDPVTKAKVITEGSSYTPTLLKYIEEEDLPKFLGGKCDCKPKGCILDNLGPWSDW